MSGQNHKISVKKTPSGSKSSYSPSWIAVKPDAGINTPEIKINGRVGVINVKLVELYQQKANS